MQLQPVGGLAGAGKPGILVKMNVIGRITGLFFPYGLSSKASAHATDVFHGYNSEIHKSS